VENVTLDALSDSIVGDLDGAGDCAVSGSIAPSASYSCSCSFDADVLGQPGDTVTNTVTAEVSDNDGNMVSEGDDASVNVTDILPAVSVTKTPNVSTVEEPSGSVTYTVTVTNDSDEDVTVTGLSDDVFGNLNGQGDCATGEVLVPDDTYTCQFTATVSGSFGDVHTNTVTATVEDDDGSEGTDSDDASVGFDDVLPEIEVTKTASESIADVSGTDITFTVTVENLTAEAATLDALTDSIYGDLDGQGTCATGGTIAAGDTYTCSFTESVSGNDNDVHTNTVTATVSDNDGNDDSDNDNASVDIVDILPSITVTKTASAQTVEAPGANVTFTITVENTSEETATLTSLTDNLYGNLNGQGTCSTGGLIAPGATYSCSFTILVEGVHGDVHINTATAVASDDDGNNATDNDSATISVVKIFSLSPPELVVYKDDAADNGSFATFLKPVINDQGAVAMIAKTKGENVTNATNTGIYVEGSSFDVVIRENDPEVGGYGAYAQFLSVLFNDQGLVAFKAKIDTPAGGNQKATGAYFEAVGSPAASRSGSKTKFSPSGAGGSASVWRGVLESIDGTNRVDTPRFNNNGHLAVHISASGETGITTRNDTSIQVIGLESGIVTALSAAQEGNAAPGITGAFFGQIGKDPSFTEMTTGPFDSVLSFNAALTGPEIDGQNNSAVFSGAVGDLTPVHSRSEKKGDKSRSEYGPRSQNYAIGPVVREGDAAPGTGVIEAVFGGFSRVRNASTPVGSVVFVGRLKNGSGTPEATSGNNTGIWTDASGALALVVRSGMRVTDSAGIPIINDVNFKSFTSGALLGQTGAVAFGARLDGVDVTSPFNFGLWSSAFGSLKKIVMEGENAPGTSAGEIIKVVKDFASNHFGDVVFTAILTGPASTNQAIYLWEAASGQTHLLMRKGDVLNIDEGAVDELLQPVTTPRIVKKTTLLKGASSGGSDGHARAFNANGEAVVVLRMSGNKRGVFILNPTTP